MTNYYGIISDFIELYKAAPKEVVADLDRLFPKEATALFQSLLDSEVREELSMERANR